MRIIAFLSFLFFIGLFFPDPVTAQGGKRFDPLRDDISDNLPPLNVLLDSAMANDPYVQFRNLQLDVNACKLKEKKLEWARNFGIQANTGYGNLYNYSTNSTEGIGTPAITTNRSQTQYNAAFYINMPISTLVDRKNQLHLAKIEIEQAEKMADMQRNETRQAVIKQYNDLVLKQRLLRIKSKYLETARINMQMVEKEFANGITSISEYSRISQIFSFAEADFESAQMDFLTTYMVLEEIVGIKFHLTNPIPKPNDGN